MESINKEAEIPINNGIYKQVEVPISNAMTYYKTNYRYTSMQNLDKYSSGKKSSMNGVKRVFAFCCLTAVLPACLIICPLYLKHQVFKEHIYQVTESDILEIREGMSTIFCQEHKLKMNSSFNAFQLEKMPNRAPKNKNIVLRKTMILPDDTLEYWGFFLLKGATVKLKVCSKHEGSRLMVVKGEKNLRTCGLLDHNQKKQGANFNAEKSQVRVTFEHREEVHNSPEKVHADNPKLKLKEDNIALDDESSLNHGGEDFTEIEKKPKRPHPKIVLINTPDSEMSKKSSQRTDFNQRRRRSHPHYHELNQNEHKVRHLSSHHARDKRDTIFDGRIAHGGNNQNAVNTNKLGPGNITLDSESSESSFENGLFDCFDGDILVANEFNSSRFCAPSSTFDHSSYLTTTHEVLSDGYYYYIFYSDNDLEKNEINAVFDINKPTYLYSNISESKQCSNLTQCSFPVKMWSDEVVIVEVPTRDGIEHEGDDVTILHSQCVPRMSVYIFFPIAVLVLVLSCAFI